MVDATASPQTIVFETAAADGFSVKKTFAVEPTSYIIAFGAVVQMGEPAAEPDDPLGPGPRRRHRARAAGVVLLAELQHAGAADHLQGRHRSSASPPTDAGIAGGRVPLRRRRRSLLRLDAAERSEHAAGPHRLRAGHVPQADDPAIIGNYVALLRCASRRRRISRDSSSARRPSTSCAAISPEATQGDQLRHLLVAGGAAARRAEVGARLHRQLGLGDRRPDAADQHWRCSRCGTRAWSRCARCRRSSRR